MSASSEEAQLIATIGSLVKLNVIRDIEKAILWGIFFVLSVAAMKSTWQRNRGLKAKSAKIVFASLIIIFVCTTAYTMNALDLLVKTINEGFNTNPDKTVVDRFAFVLEEVIGSKQSYANKFFGNNPGILMIIGDVVVLWRAWAIWRGSKLFVLPAIFLTIAAFVLSLTSNTMIVYASIHTGTIANTSVIAIIAITALVCSFTSNAITTALIAFQALQHRHYMRKTTGRSSQASRVLLFLTEAGAVYLVLQVISFTLSILDLVPFSAIDYASTLWGVFTIYASASYPALVVLLISHDRSLVKTDVGTSGALSSNFTPNITFGNPQLALSQGDQSEYESPTRDSIKAGWGHREGFGYHDGIDHGRH